MLYSTTTFPLDERIGLKDAVEMIADAGFPAIDLSIHSGHEIEFLKSDGYLDEAADIIEKSFN